MLIALELQPERLECFIGKNRHRVDWFSHHSLDVPVVAPKRCGSGASDATPLVYLVRSVEQPAIREARHSSTHRSTAGNTLLEITCTGGS